MIKYLDMVLELSLLCSLTLPCCNRCLTEPLKLCKCGFDQIPTHTLALPRLQLSELTSESLNSGAVLKSNICTYPSKTYSLVSIIRQCRLTYNGFEYEIVLYI